MSRSHRALVGLMAAGLLTAPVLTAVAAPKKPAPKKPAAPKADPKKGQAQFKSEGCAGCHKTKEIEGSEVGPDLSAIGTKQKAAQIAAYIKKPKAGSVMPAFKGPQSAVDNMTAYLLTQK
jgi:mono/diheme cytochrome c family protein